MIKKTLLAIAVIGGVVPLQVRAGGISIAKNACLLPWQWNGPLEVFTVDHSPSYVARNGNSTG